MLTSTTIYIYLTSTPVYRSVFQERVTQYRLTGLWPENLVNWYKTWKILGPSESSTMEDCLSVKDQQPFESIPANPGIQHSCVESDQSCHLRSLHTSPVPLTGELQNRQTVTDKILQMQIKVYDSIVIISLTTKLYIMIKVLQTDVSELALG